MFSAQTVEKLRFPTIRRVTAHSRLAQAIVWLTHAKRNEQWRHMFLIAYRYNL